MWFICITHIDIFELVSGRYNTPDYPPARIYPSICWARPKYTPGHKLAGLVYTRSIFLPSPASLGQIIPPYVLHKRFCFNDQNSYSLTTTKKLIKAPSYKGSMEQPTSQHQSSILLPRIQKFIKSTLDWAGPYAVTMRDVPWRYHTLSAWALDSRPQFSSSPSPALLFYFSCLPRSFLVNHINWQFKYKCNI